MKVQPRQQLIEIWRATARSSFVNGEWAWGGRYGTNSISDAEHLLCLMTPATDVPAFKLDQPDETAEDITDALKVLGDSVRIPQLLVRAISKYMETYTDDDGAPIFSGGSYFASADAGEDVSLTQQRLDVVDSFAISVTLSLATIGFLRVFRGAVRRPELRAEVDALEEMASRRLTAAMVGLLRSFTVNVFDPDDDYGKVLLRTANQDGLPDRVIVEELRKELREVHARLRDDVTIGSGADQASSLENPHKLFECGWSWGIVKGAPEVRLTEEIQEIGPQRDGVAPGEPYLYFTVVALDGIQALFSERTRLLGLLNETQLRLAQPLQLRWDLTQSYWSTIARFGKGRWPLEDLPWRTTDGVQSDYLSLLVSSIMVQDLVTRRASDEDLSRVGRVLEELANRARITRREFPNDPALELHSPGMKFELSGGPLAGGPRLHWVVPDFAPLLLHRTVRVAGLLRAAEPRQHVTGLADAVWNHIEQRRISEEAGRELWDQAGNVFAGLKTEDARPSWYYTKRVVDCLVTASRVITSPPVHNPRLFERARDRLNEADHLIDQELLDGSSEAGPAMRAHLAALQEKLRRAHRIVRDRPGTADVLAGEVLSALDGLAAAREGALGGS
ncbi:MAG: hypothetical protein AUI14_03785 [Actinobacteria bacterium 13_2_20CM_2_71_6]|nr:MAG: hypothetical protein AUI14_03785 [Actinobacteria bacterium 13_2_20CM_2_71_6]